MPHTPRLSGGFTLIELLVVIAIIGVLSAVILASLNTARLKASDAQVLSEAQQLQTVMQYEISDSGNYTNIKNGSNGGGGAGWLAAGNTCSGFGGNYATQATNICNALVAATGSVCKGSCVYFAATNPNSVTQYTIMAYLPYQSALAGASRWVCYGSSGANSISVGPQATPPWTEPGCYSNP